MDYERSDELPEYTDYPDEGCSLAPSCLNCPHPRCKYDIPGRERSFLKERRNAEILRRFMRGDKLKEIAAAFRLSKRMVGRIVKNTPGTANVE